MKLDQREINKNINRNKTCVGGGGEGMGRSEPMSSPSLSIKFHNLKFLNEMIKDFRRNKKIKRHDKNRDSCRVKIS